jgi:hypothetical protein
MGVGGLFITKNPCARNVSRNVGTLLLLEGGAYHHVGKWLQLFQPWDHIDLEHVKVDTPCDGPLIKEKWAYHSFMHEHTSHISL